MEIILRLLGLILVMAFVYWLAEEFKKETEKEKADAAAEKDRQEHRRRRWNTLLSKQERAKRWNDDVHRRLVIVSYVMIFILYPFSTYMLARNYGDVKSFESFAAYFALTNYLIIVATSFFTHKSLSFTQVLNEIPVKIKILVYGKRPNLEDEIASTKNEIKSINKRIVELDLILAK